MAQDLYDTKDKYPLSLFEKLMLAFLCTGGTAILWALAWLIYRIGLDYGRIPG